MDDDGVFITKLPSRSAEDKGRRDQQRAIFGDSDEAVLKWHEAMEWPEHPGKKKKQAGLWNAESFGGTRVPMRTVCRLNHRRLDTEVLLT